MALMTVFLKVFEPIEIAGLQGSIVSKQVVSFLLMQIDQLPSYVLTIAATNHAELLDRAVWRRFQLRMAFPAPQKNEVAAFLQKIIESWPERPTVAPLALADQLGALSYAEARDFCQNVRRRHILGLGELGIDTAIRVELDLWAARVKPEAMNADRPAQTASSVKRQRITAQTPRSPGKPNEA